MTEGDIIKIGTTDVIIKGNNKGPMIFGESTNISKKEDTTASKTTDPKYSMPDGAHRDWHDLKSGNCNAWEQRTVRKSK
jgi:hypothetical protein